MHKNCFLCVYHISGQESSVGESMMSPDLPHSADDTRSCLLCARVGDDKPDVRRRVAGFYNSRVV